ncbi:uncharacterized mitochondrial protein-like protein, partial [Tanacetum coccineum]
IIDLNNLNLQQSELTRWSRHFMVCIKHQEHDLCTGFEKLMKDKFQMSAMGELTFFLRLQVQQKKDGIFISQDKYIAEILKKFNYTDVKSASTLVDLEKPLVKNGDADDVDVHLYRSMIGSLMYLTTSRPDIMFAVCACARFKVTPKTSHLLAVKSIFRYLKGKPTLGLWYSRDSPFELVTYTDSDYAGATQNRKSTTEAEYVATASCYGQVLWIQNQLLDYGHVKRGRDIKIPQSSGPPVQVSDEAVHKELGDRMEMAATTASSLKAEQDSGSGPRCQDTILGDKIWLWTCFLDDIGVNTGLAYKVTTVRLELVLLDFLQDSTTEDRVQAITATIDGREKTITKASLRRHLNLEDSEGLTSLPNEEILEHLTYMGYEITSDIQPQDEEPSTSPSKITSSPSLSSQLPQPSPSPPPMQTTHDTEEPAPMSYDSPLQSVHSLGCDEGRMQQTKLMEMVTKLSERVMAVEEDLTQTKKVYSSAFTKLVLKVKKLEKQVKSGKARRRVRIVLSDDEDAVEDPSKQGRKIAQVDTDPTISLVQDEDTSWVSKIRPLEVVIKEKRNSTANVLDSTAKSSKVKYNESASKAKDKGKAIMQELKPPKKLKKRVQVQLSVNEELARKVQEEEQAKAMAKQE